MKTKTNKDYGGLLEWIYKPQSELYRRVNYTKHILLTGLLKSTTETSLLVIGFNLIFYGMVSPSQFKDFVIPLGVIAIMASILVDFWGDHVKMKQKDDEYAVTENLMDEKIETQAVTEAVARKIAEKLISKEMERIDDAICNNNPESLCNKKVEK